MQLALTIINFTFVTHGIIQVAASSLFGLGCSKLPFSFLQTAQQSTTSYYRAMVVITPNYRFK